MFCMFLLFLQQLSPKKELRKDACEHPLYILTISLSHLLVDWISMLSCHSFLLRSVTRGRGRFEWPRGPLNPLSLRVR